MKQLALILLFLISVFSSYSQTYSLTQCIEYAKLHNITIQQSRLNVKLNALQVKQVKYAQYPSLNADVSNGFSVGRSVDPTSNSFINQGYYYNGINVGSNVLLFGWFANKYRIEQSEIDTKVSIENFKQLQSDIGLNIAVGYLRILLAKEQVNINQSQLENNILQYKFTKASVAAGQLPELNAAQLFAQVMNDSATVISSKLDVNSALLDMKALLNMNMQDVFDIEYPNLNSVNIEALLNYPNPEEIYNKAILQRASVIANGYKVASAKKQMDISKAALYPQLNLSLNLGTNYASTVKDVTGLTYKGEEFLGNIKVLDSIIPVTRPAYNYNFASVPLFKQYSNNFRQNIGLGFSIPIFNGYSSRINIERMKINIENAQYVLELDQTALKQNVYKAFNDAQSAVQKLKSAKQSEQASVTALDFAKKRYTAGMLSTQEYTNQQNNVTRAKILVVQAQFDFIFKLKIIDFYLGKEIQL